MAGAALARFYDADRRFRSPRSTARDLWDRATALRALGFRDAAAADLAEMEARGFPDPDALLWSVRHHPEPAARSAAARIAVADHRIGDAARDAAAASLLSGGDPVVGHAWRRGGRVLGWLAWRGEGDGPTLEAAGTGLIPLRIGVPRGGLHRATFDLALDPTLPAALVASLGGRPGPVLPIYPAAAPRPARAAAGGAALTVVVPVYGDPDALAACLDALRREDAGDIAHVLVDDASPDPAASRLARAFCAEAGGTYLRMPANAGFAGAVNAGLALCPAGDALILNADVWLPPGALGRLRAAAAREPGIGTVSPMSNDPGCAGFPDPRHGTAALPPARASAVDAAARRLHAGQVADALAPLGSCLYATRACLDRVGPLSAAYGRGYYEDVDLHLRAIEAGLRSVIACDVYVSHLGGRSFGARKRALVERNHAVLLRRFPGFAAADAAFDRADPLRARRAAIEEHLAPRLAGARLVVARACGADALLADRRRAAAERGVPAVALLWRPDAGGLALDVAAPGDGGPRSLRFALDRDGAARAAACLARIGAAEVELLEPETLPDPVAALLRATGLPVSALVEGPAAARTVAPGAALAGAVGRTVAAVARDRLARAVLAGSAAAAHPPPRAARIATLGVPMPQRCPRAEGVTLALARALRRLGRSTRLVVLGRAIDPDQLMSPGNLWVSGPLGDDDPAAVAAHHAVDGLFSPYRAELFWHVEDVARGLGCSKAYFDWSGGRAPCEAGDLALDASAGAEAVGAGVAAWCGPPGTAP